MAIAPLIVRIQALGVAALARTAAGFRALAGAAASAARTVAARVTPAFTRLAAALRLTGPISRAVAGFRALGTALASAARAVYGRLLPALRALGTALRVVGSLALRAAVIIGGALRRALRAAADAAFNLAQAIAAFVLRWTGILGTILPIVFALVGVLASLLPLVMHLAPAAIAAGAALLTLKLGFEGVGDALSAGLSGDMKEFEKSLKKLAPSAQSFVRELVKVAPAWRELKRLVQERLFHLAAGEVKGLSDALGRIAVTWLPRIAQLFNDFARAVSQGLQSPEFAKQMDTIMKGVTTFIFGFLHAVRMIGRAFLDIAEVAAPAFGELGASIGIAADKFSLWIQELKDNGTLKRWLDQAKETFQQIMDIGREIGRVLSAIFKGTDEGGFLEGIKNSLSELADFLEGEDGQAMIEFFSDVASAAAGLIRTIGDVVRWFQDGIDYMRELTRGLREALHGDFGAIGAAASGLFAVIAGGVNAFGWIGGVLSRLGGLVAGVRGAVSAINAALSAIRTSVIIDIVTRRSEVTGYARPIGSAPVTGGGGGGGRVTARAGGGPVRAGQPYIVGERRAELFIPGRSGYVSPSVPMGGSAVALVASPAADSLFATMLNKAIRTGLVRLRVSNNRVVPA